LLSLQGVDPGKTAPWSHLGSIVRAHSRIVSLLL
jgi:hypothetical protein